MAPHDTNTPKEARRHAFPLVMLAILLAAVLLGFLWWVSRASGLTGEADPEPMGGLETENAEDLRP